MPRIYKPKPGAKIRKTYDELIIKQALEELANKQLSISCVANKYGISKSVLGRHKLRDMKKSGGQTALSVESEEFIVENLNTCADWGYPLTTMDLRYIVKMYLDSLGIKHTRFKGNLPGPDFVCGFLKRNKDKISKRLCQNIKRARAAISPAVINEYFAELKKSIENVPLCNIINYDETNLADDPGRKQVIVRRGCKYPERIMNHTKGSVSLMIAATADGEMLPPYVVYKASHLYSTWVRDGPVDARYNRSESGWFDGQIFTDWIQTVILPSFGSKPGKKILIGDNLSSHLSIEVIKQCREKDIDFVFLPANSTHLTQPLDVAFFRPMKAAWRQLLEKWKRTDGRVLSSIPKGCFPRLLKLLVNQLQEKAESNIKAGFRKTGIAPLDVDQILARLPNINDSQADKEAVDNSFVQFLKEMRFGTMDIQEPKNKKKLTVVPGRSVSVQEAEEEQKKPVTKKPKLAKNENPITSQRKGKGVGKKSKPNAAVVIDKENSGQMNKNIGRDKEEITSREIKRKPVTRKSELNSVLTLKKDNDYYTEKNIEKQIHKTNLGHIDDMMIYSEKTELEEEKLMEIANVNDEKHLFVEVLDSQSMMLDSTNIADMPIVFADSLNCNDEVIIENEEEPVVLQEQLESRNIVNKKPSQVKIISNVLLPLPVTKKRRTAVKKTNFYNEAEEILKILEEE